MVEVYSEAQDAIIRISDDGAAHYMLANWKHITAENEQ